MNIPLSNAHQDDRFWIEQERLADEGKAKQAREILELIREKEIERQRMNAGLCMFCGQRIRIVPRWFRIKKHLRCRDFIE